MQATKALRVGQLHNYLVQERPTTLEELYDNFRKLSKSEVLHFCKIDQQRKAPRVNEASRSTKYNKSRESMLSFDNAHKHIHNINSDGCEPRENWEKIFGPSTSEKIITTPEVAT
jgi:hypothetical protein